jgi:hypothetical protein
VTSDSLTALASYFHTSKGCAIKRIRKNGGFSWKDSSGTPFTVIILKISESDSVKVNLDLLKVDSKEEGTDDVETSLDIDSLYIPISNEVSTFVESPPTTLSVTLTADADFSVDTTKRTL